jgi:AcrR family transcriptional regulator
MDKRKRILESALRLFAELGFHGTPTSRIAQEAGVANGTLFHYFATKDDLILALYKSIKDDLARASSEQLGEADSLKAAMKTQYVAALYWAADHPMHFRFIQQFQNSPFSAMMDGEEAQRYIRPHHAMLESGIAAGIIKSLPVDLIYTLIMSHTYGLNEYLAKNTLEKSRQHELIDETFELLWDMFT